FRVIRRDGHEADALVLVIGHQLLDALLVILSSRAVIACEDHHQDFRLVEITQLPALSVHAGQVEVRRLSADLQRRDLRFINRRDSGREGNSQDYRENSFRDHRSPSENPWVRIASSALSAGAQFPFNKPIAKGRAGSDAYSGE